MRSDEHERAPDATRRLDEAADEGAVPGLESTGEVPVQPDEREARVVLQNLRRKMFGAKRDEHIGRYELVRRLGTGGMGVVYLARDPELGRKVAIKLLSGSRDASARGRLAREARSLARLSHPHVVQVFDVGDHDGELYVAMEYLAGGDLKDWLAAETRAPEEILSTFVAAGRGLAAAHETGVVHRDFKPQNVLIDAQGRAVVADFGLARVDGHGTAGLEDSSIGGHDAGASGGGGSAVSSVLETQTGSQLGTPAYMAPEQHEGQRADARSDQFAYCVALWEALTGKRPFSGRTLFALRDQVLGGAVEAPARKMPPHIEAALRRGLSVDPEARFASIEDLLEVLEGDPRRRRRARFAAVSAVALSVVAGASTYRLVSRPGDACEASQTRLEAMWSTERRAVLTERLGPRGAKWYAGIAEQVEALGDATAAACAPGESAAARLSRLACLEERRAELETLVELIETPGPTTGALLVRLTEDQPEPGPNGLPSLGVEDPAFCLDERRRTLPEGEGAKAIRRAVQKLRLELARARVWWRSGDLEPARESLVLLRHQAREVGYGPAEAEVLTTLGEVLAAQGNAAEAESTLEEAVALAERHGDLQVAAEANAALVGVRGFQQGATRSAEDEARRVRRDLARLGGVRETVLAAKVDLQLARAYSISGRLDEALAAIQRAAAVQLGDGAASVEVLAQLGLNHALLGDYEKAEEPLERSKELLTQDGSQSVFVHGSLGMLRSFQGRDELARQAFERTLELAEDRKRVQPHYASIAKSYLSQVELRAGKIERAAALAQASVEELEAHFGPDNPINGRARLHWGRILAERGDADAARVEFERVAELWRRSHGASHRALALPATALWEIDEAAGAATGCETLEAAKELITAARNTDPGHRAENAATDFALARCRVLMGAEASEQRELIAEARAALASLGPGYQAQRDAIAAWAADVGLELAPAAIDKDATMKD